jgi:hypothetical protein
MIAASLRCSEPFSSRSNSNRRNDSRRNGMGWQVDDHKVIVIREGSSETVGLSQLTAYRPRADWLWCKVQPFPSELSGNQPTGRKSIPGERLPRVETTTSANVRHRRFPPVSHVRRFKFKFNESERTAARSLPSTSKRSLNPR